ncbi:MAG: UPF0158 family protein [Actinomycetota bacterium]
MLDPDRVDLRALAEALEDHSGMNAWYLDPETGAVEPFLEDATGDEPAPPDDWIQIQALESREAYEDLENFVARVGDSRARDLLSRAIGGRGAFRRFKDTLFEFPELREAWFAFHDARMRRRALRWLADEGLADEVAVERATKDVREPDLPQLAEVFDAEKIARAVASDLREFYGSRLREIIMYGSAARGEAHEESDIDLLVVLDHIDSPYQEIERTSEIAWRHTLEHHVLVSIVHVSEAEIDQGKSAFLRNAQRDGRRVA